MTDFFDIVGRDNLDSLFAELDKDFYKANPELWDDSEDDFFIRGEDYTNIIQGNSSSHDRLRQKGEETTSQYIKRDGYHLWKVGREYTVKHHNSKMRDVHSHPEKQEVNDGVVSETHGIAINQAGIIGRVRLASIIPGHKILWKKDVYDRLVFEVLQ